MRTSNRFRLFVQNFPYSTDETELFSFLSRWADIAAVKITRDEAGRSRGFGFTDCTDEQAVEQLLELDGYEFKGRPLHVERAR